MLSSEFLTLLDLRKSKYLGITDVSSTMNPLFASYSAYRSFIENMLHSHFLFVPEKRIYV